LFFDCPIAKFVWSCVGKAIGAPNRSGNFSHSFGGTPILPCPNVQIAGIAAICWAIWKLQNRACCEGKLISLLAGVIFYSFVL
jgi:hypothetical protein